MNAFFIRTRRTFALLFACAAALGGSGCREQSASSPEAVSLGANVSTQRFAVKGVVRELKPDGRTVIIRHEEIPSYMEAMTMPFKVRDTNELTRVTAGDEVAFRLNVTEDASWIDEVRPTGRRESAAASSLPPAAPAVATNRPGEFTLASIPEFALTNEFGQPVSLRQFAGSAVAMTFFFTRCPVPEYCPRLSKNFQGAIVKLKARPDGPTNFHFLSVSFDPIDSPLVLRAYARGYNYDSNSWTFLTGNTTQITELAAGFGVFVKPDGGGFDHNFSTVIFDAAGRLQNMWPIGGDMTDQIVNDLVKGAAAR